MKHPVRIGTRTALLALSLAGLSLSASAPFTLAQGKLGEPLASRWEHSGWGGGGFYYASAFHPTKEGVIYLGGDVAGMYKSTDGGKSFRIINKGIPGYGIFSIAVSAAQPDLIYAATDEGLAKSTDAGETWQTIPQGGKKQLRLTGEKNKSVRSVAIDPKNPNRVFVGSPSGKLYLTEDGGATWNLAWEPGQDGEAPKGLRVQFGKNNGDFFGGLWQPLEFPTGLDPAGIEGFGISFTGAGSKPQQAYLNLKTSDGLAYRSIHLGDFYANPGTQEILLKASDFIIDPDLAKKNPEKVAGAPATPDWSKVNRMDFSTAGNLPGESYVIHLGQVYYQAGGKQVPLHDFSQDKALKTYGNIKGGKAEAGTVWSVAIAPSNPRIVAAGTAGSGIVLSGDGGKTWAKLATPAKAKGVNFDPQDPNVIYGAFASDGVQKSTDGGKTWTKLSKGIDPKLDAIEVVVSPTNPQDLYLMGAIGWGGGIFYSRDGGASWTNSSQFTVDAVDNPTSHGDGTTQSVSNPRNIAVNPRNPKEIYVAANWRSLLSTDGGVSWKEANAGADISCVTDIRFSDTRTYVTCMDEGVFLSANGGEKWQQLWPTKYDAKESGHYWRVAVNNVGGVDRVIATASPWNAPGNHVVVSEDGGKSFQSSQEGLPAERPKANTMWGEGYARALATDPRNPMTVFLGIDGDPGKGGDGGGGVFKSMDGGLSWKPLANQPGSRRMFFGLAVDPTDPQRLYWGACNTNGGLYRSEDGGGSWKNVFNKDQWIFNVHVTKDGTVYVPGKGLWVSTDHGDSWKPLINFDLKGGTVVALETHPEDPKTIWISTSTWDGSSNGAVYKTSDSGATWHEITGDLPYVKPLILRYNHATKELWSGGVTLHKLKQ